MGRTKLIIKGFSDMLDEIEKAQGNVDRFAASVTKEVGDVYQSELKKQMAASGVSSDLINRMPPPETSKLGNIYSVAVGYDKGAYDPKDPSDAYLAIFINYGTPRVSPRGFIDATKKATNKKMETIAKEAYDRAMEGLMQ